MLKPSYMFQCRNDSARIVVASQEEPDKGKGKGKRRARPVVVAGLEKSGKPFIEVPALRAYAATEITDTVAQALLQELAGIVR